MITVDIESLRSFAIAHNEVAFAHLCTAALSGEQWALARVELVLAKFAERDGDGEPPCDEDIAHVLETTDTTRPDGAIARRHRTEDRGLIVATADTREVTPDDLTDEQIVAYRDDHRWAGDADVVRCCNGALGLPTGDGALGLLDAATCRARLAPRIAGNQYYTVDAINARAKAVR